jgi:type VI secretion system protein ImpM
LSERDLRQGGAIEPQRTLALEDAKSTGCYGKIPGTGDFITRHLPSSFVSRWDRWLQESLAGARELLGDRWESTYFTAPVWRFVLAPGICDEQGWAGVLMPSVDQVGRAFPLTLSAPLAGVQQLAAALFDRMHWFARLEEVALGMLRAGADIRGLEVALLDVPFPDDERSLGPQLETVSATQALAQSHEAPLRLGLANDFAAILSMAATESFIGAAAWSSYWWTWGRSESQSAALVLNGLPDVRTFAAMLSV